MSREVDDLLGQLLAATRDPVAKGHLRRAGELELNAGRTYDSDPEWIQGEHGDEEPEDVEAEDDEEDLDETNPDEDPDDEELTEDQENNILEAADRIRSRRARDAMPDEDDHRKDFRVGDSRYGFDSRANYRRIFVGDETPSDSIDVLDVLGMRRRK